MRAGASSGVHAWFASHMIVASSPSAARISARFATSRCAPNPTFSLNAR